MAVVTNGETRPAFIGRAIFSTDCGRRPPQPAEYLHPPPIARSDIAHDVFAFAERLGERYPEECAKITLQAEMPEYFDSKDVQRQTYEFLMMVLQHIALTNTARDVAYNFAIKNKHNQELWERIRREVSVEEVFSREEIHHFGYPLAMAVLWQLRKGMCLLVKEQKRNPPQPAKTPSAAPGTASSVHRELENKQSKSENAKSSGPSRPIGSQTNVPSTSATTPRGQNVIPGKSMPSPH